MLIQQLLQINEAKEAAEGGFAIELQKDGKCKGYYVADDRGTSKSAKKARKYASMAAAKKDAKLSNSQWDLDDGEKFVAVALQEEPITESEQFNEEYAESSDFDADMDKAQAALNDALKIVRSTSWKKHMKDTDFNYGTEGKDRSAEIEKDLQAVITSLDKLYHHFIEEAN